MVVIVFIGRSTAKNGCDPSPATRTDHDRVIDLLMKLRTASVCRNSRGSFPSSDSNTKSIKFWRIGRIAARTHIHSPKPSSIQSSKKKIRKRHQEPKKRPILKRNPKHFVSALESNLHLLTGLRVQTQFEFGSVQKTADEPNDWRRQEACNKKISHLGASHRLDMLKFAGHSVITQSPLSLLRGGRGGIILIRFDPVWCRHDGGVLGNQHQVD